MTGAVPAGRVAADVPEGRPCGHGEKGEAADQHDPAHRVGVEHEEVDEQEGGEEPRDGDGAERARRRHAVEGGARATGGEEGEGDGDHQRHEHAQQRDLERDGQARGDHLRHRALGRQEGGAEVARQGVTQPVEVARQQGVVQAELGPDLLVLLRGGVRTGDGGGGVAGHELEHEERGQADEEQHRHEMGELQADRADHRTPLSGTRGRRPP